MYNLINKVVMLLLCFSIKNIAQAKKIKTPLLENIIETRTDGYYHFMQATYLHAKGDTKKALLAFKGIMKIRPSEHALEPYLQVLFDAESFSEMIKIYESNKTKLNTLFKENYLLKGYIAQAYLAKNKVTQANKMFKELISEHGNDVQLCYFTAVGYLKTKRSTEAISLLKQCVKNEALKNKHYLFHFLLSKAYLEKNNPTEAMVNIELSINQFPRFDRGWLFKAILHEQQGKITAAIHGYKKFLDISGRDHSIEKQLVQLLFMEQRYSEAIDYLKKLSLDSAEYCFDLALLQSKHGAYSEALQAINKFLILKPNLEKAKLLKVEILLNSNKIDAALTFLTGWLSENPHNLGILRTFLLLKQGNIAVEKVLTALESVHAKQPQNLGIVTALADLSFDAGNTEKSLNYYEQALDRTDLKKLKSKIYFQRCYILLKSNDYTRLNAEIDRAKKDDCIDHAMLNLEAYYYAQTNQQLDKALEFIDKALHIKKNRPAYLDTKAQVLTLLGKNTEALLFAKKALTLAPHDFLIQQHVKELTRNAGYPKQSYTTNTLHSRR